MWEKVSEEKQWGSNLPLCAVHLKLTSGHVEWLGDIVFTVTEVCLVLLVPDLNGCQKNTPRFQVLFLAVREAVKELRNWNICYVAL